MSNAGRKRSEIWNYFSISVSDEKKAVCHECQENVARGGDKTNSFNTSNLRKHLRNRHPEKLRELEENEKEASRKKAVVKEQTSSSQATLEECLEWTRPYPIDHPVAQRITHFIAEMMALDCQPFSIVEDQVFVRLLNHLQPRYQLPSRKYFSSTMIPQLYDSCKKTLQKVMEAQSFIALTSDIWSSRGHDSVISFTAHFITDKFIRGHCLLQASKFNERHTGDNIATMYSDCVCEWKIESKIVCALRDGGSNFVAGFNRSGVPSITCLAHSLQRVILDGVLAQKDVQDLLAAGRKIVGHYKHSNVAFHLLQRIQAQLELKVCALYQDEPTRWNSSYYMLKRLVEQRKAVSAANAEADASFDLTAAQWKLAEKVIKLLLPFEEATEDISSDSSSIALFIPIVNSLNKLLQVDEEDHGIMSMKRKMLLSMQNRFASCETEDLYCLSTLLDPRFKNRVFSSQSSMISSKERLISRCEDYLGSSQSVACEPDTSSVPKRPRKDDSASVLWAQVDEMMKVHDGEPDDDYIVVQKMVNAYLSETNAPQHSNPLLYWKEKQASWPLLATLARKYLAPPCTTVPSERLFSTAGNVVTDKRTRLDAEKVEMLLFLNKNMFLKDN